jgi:Protein of unknown function (DUF2917)
MTKKGQAMNSLLMPELHQNPVRTVVPARPWAWQLARHEATTLVAAPEPRWLLVTAGSVWVTQVTAATASDPPADIWLAPGQSLPLPPGSRWVMEAWQAAEVSLAMRVEPPTPRAIKRGLSFWRRAGS